VFKSDQEYPGRTRKGVCGGKKLVGKVTGKKGIKKAGKLQFIQGENVNQEGPTSFKKRR